VTPSAKRQAIALLVSEHRLSVVRACQVARLARAAWYRPPPDRVVRDGPGDRGAQRAGGTESPPADDRPMPRATSAPEYHLQVAT
jgi:hypothetical protein